MSEPDLSRQLQRLRCLLERLASRLGMCDGSFKVPFDHGRAQTMKIKITRSAHLDSPRRKSALGHRLVLPIDGDPQGLPGLLVDAERGFGALQRYCGFCLGGQKFNLGFGRIEATIRDGRLCDLLVNRRVLLTEVENA